MNKEPFRTHQEKRWIENQNKMVNIPQLMEWIKEHKPKLNRLPKEKLSIRKYGKYFGGEWVSENYCGWTLKFGDGSHVLVASVYHIEDDPNGGQGDSYFSHACCGLESFNQIPAKEILNKLKNLIS